ncbi:outer membrane protein assembly factor BamB family protein [Bythopirellula polymerisocia]|nr:PQQ-binding-like beta-propeller repeat protein [Bythopirellula polymerisocia]
MESLPNGPLRLPRTFGYTGTIVMKVAFVMHALTRRHQDFPNSSLLSIVLLGSWIVGIALFCAPQESRASSLVSYAEAAPLGLERVWFAQARVDVSRHRVTNWVLYQDNLLAASNGGLVQSFNAETGETLWATQAGPLDQPAFGPAASQNYVALVSGASLYALDRANGRLLWSQPLGSAPAAAPALSDTDAYVPFLSGRIESYQLDDPKKPTWYFQSVGRIFHAPTVSGDLVSWPTSRGYLYVGQSTSPHVLYRIQTNSIAVAPPTEGFNLLYVAVEDGNVHCFKLLNGQEKWRYSMGFPGTGRPGVVGERLYVASSEPMLHALDAVSGKELWSIPDVTHFAAQGTKNVYGLDGRGRLVVINKETGQYVGTLPGPGRFQAVFNEQSDRIYLVDSRGLVQCLREIGAVEPTMHRETAAEAGGDETQEEGTSPFAEEAPADDQPPMDQPAADDAEESPFSAEPNDDNPFGF